MNDWRTSPECAGAIGSIRTWITDRRSEVERGDIARARAALEDPGWRIDMDLTGVPLPALARIDEFVESACDALADRDLAPATAIRALDEAIAVVTPPGPP